VNQPASGSPGLPVRSIPDAGAAERFEQEVLDLFQIRRCQGICPLARHPGVHLIYALPAAVPKFVGAEEYHSEVNRLVEFLVTAARSQLHSIAAARDRFSGSAAV